MLSVHGHISFLDNVISHAEGQDEEEEEESEEEEDDDSDDPGDNEPRRARLRLRLKHATQQAMPKWCPPAATCNTPEGEC